MTHICVGNLTIIGSDNGLAPGRRQVFIWINDWIFVGLRPVIQILCHVLARGWGRWLRYFTEAKAEVKYRASARIRRIKTGHSNLVSCFGPRMRALAKVFYRVESRGKIPCQRPNPRAKTWHKIWMTGLNPNYDTTPIPSLQNSQNKCPKSSFTYDHRRHLILTLPPVHAFPIVNAPTCCQGAPIDDVTISYFRSHGQFESLVNASSQRIILWIFRTPIMHID